LEKKSSKCARPDEFVAAKKALVFMCSNFTFPRLHFARDSGKAPAVEEGDTAFDGRPDYRLRLSFVSSRTVAEAHSHAAEPDGRNLQVSVPSFRFFIFELLSLS